MGWKQVQSLLDGKVICKRNESFYYVTISGQFTFTGGAGKETTLTTLSHVPPTTLTITPNYSVNHNLYLKSDGNLIIKNATSTTAQYLWGIFIYPV